jgi:hypothetical protein
MAMMSDAEFSARWRDASVATRTRLLEERRSRSQPASEPSPAISSLASTVREAPPLSAEETERRSRQAAAMRELEAALAAEREAAVQQQHEEVAQMMDNPLGRFVTGGHHAR